MKASLSILAFLFALASGMLSPQFSQPAMAGPLGNFEAISSSGVLYGWAAHPWGVIHINIYVNGPYGQGGTYVGAATANQSRPDVAAVYGYGAYSGFSFQLPAQYLDGQTRQFYIHAIDPEGIYHPLLYSTPRAFTFVAPISRCYVEMQACPNVGVWEPWALNDSYNGSATSLNACMARLRDYRSWCGAGPEIKVTAYNSKGAVVKSDLSSGYKMRTIVGGPTEAGTDPVAAVGIFRVDSYGAKADGVTDSLPGLQKAIQAAVASKKAAKVVFSAGTYRLNCKADTPCLSLSGLSHLTIAGNGYESTRLVINNPRAGGFLVRSSTHVYFQNFSVDYATPPAAQGTVQAASGGQLTVQFDAGFPLPNDTAVFMPHNKGLSFGMVFSPGTFSIREPNAMFNLGFQQVSGRQFLVTNVPQHQFAVGDKFIYPVRNYKPTFHVLNSSHIGLMNLAQYAAPDVAMQFVENSGSIVVNNFRLMRKSGRVLTASGGAIWTMNNTARFAIKNSYFEGMGDDVLDLMTQGQPASKPLAQIPFLANAVNPVLQYVGNFKFARDWAAPGSLFVNNTMGAFRGAVRVHSAGAIIQNNRFTNKENGYFVLDADIQSADGLGGAWAEGPGLGGAGFQMPYFIGNSAGGQSVRIVTPNWSSSRSVD